MTKFLRSALLAAVAFTGAGLGLSSPAAACPADAPYIGSICYMTTDFCPDGYQKAQGQLVPINQYQALYSLFGNLWGGSQQAGTFALPDMRGRVPVGTGQGPGLANVQRSQVFGVENVTLTSSNVAPHVHPVTVSGTSGLTGTASVATPVVGTAGSATNDVPGTTMSLAAPVYDDPSIGTPNPVKAYSAAAPTTTLKPFNAPITVSGVSGIAVGPNTGGLPFSVRNPSVGLTACIAVLGIYPTRP